MLGGWVLDLVEGSDIVHVEVVEVFSGDLFLFMGEEGIAWCSYPCEFYWRLFHGEFFNVGIYVDLIFSFK